MRSRPERSCASIHEPRSRWRARLGMSASAVSIIARASDATPDPYSADSIASSNRNTSARSCGGNRRAGRAPRRLPTPSGPRRRCFACRRSARPGPIEWPGARPSIVPRQALCGPRPACARPRGAPAVFAARPRSPDLRRWAETTAIRHATPHHSAGRHFGQRDDVDALVCAAPTGSVTFWKMPCSRDLISGVPGAGERPDELARVQATGLPIRKGRSAWSRSPRIFRSRD